MALEAKISNHEADRLILEEYSEGVYVLAFRPGEKWPYRDNLQDNWKMAMLQAMEDYGVSEDILHEIPDTGIMG